MKHDMPQLLSGLSVKLTSEEFHDRPTTEWHNMGISNIRPKRPINC